MQIARKSLAGTIDAQRAGRKLVVTITGRFDFAMHQEFRRKVSDLSAVSEVAVDLHDTSYLDSSALGMLLLLHDACTALGITASLVGCIPSVRQVLEVASFHQLFTIS